MNQELIEPITNYMTEQDLAKFQWSMLHLDTFQSERSQSPMTENQFVILIQVVYECGLRISEGLKLRKSDIDLTHRILTIRSPKTSKNGKQKTTITPMLAELLALYIKDLPEDTLLFPCNRQLVWRYAKDAGRLAGLPIFESQTQRDIDGVWTHLFRKSCSKRMAELGASRELRMKKLRHAFRDAHDAYDVVDINALLKWESENLPVSKYADKQNQRLGENRIG